MKKEYRIDSRRKSVCYIEDFTDPNWVDACKLPTYGNSDNTVEITIDDNRLIILERAHSDNIAPINNFEFEGMRAEKIVLPLHSIDYLAIFKDTDAADMDTMKLQMGFGGFMLFLEFTTDSTFSDFLSSIEAHTRTR